MLEFLFVIYLKFPVNQGGHGYVLLIKINFHVQTDRHFFLKCFLPKCSFKLFAFTIFALKMFAFQMFPLKMFAFIILFIVLYRLFVKGLISNSGCNTISYGKSDYDPAYSFLFHNPTKYSASAKTQVIS